MTSGLIRERSAQSTNCLLFVQIHEMYELLRYARSYLLCLARKEARLSSGDNTSCQLRRQHPRINFASALFLSSDSNAAARSSNGAVVQQGNGDADLFGSQHVRTSVQRASACDADSICPEAAILDYKLSKCQKDWMLHTTHKSPDNAVQCRNTALSMFCFLVHSQQCKIFRRKLFLPGPQETSDKDNLEARQASAEMISMRSGIPHFIHKTIKIFLGFKHSEIYSAVKKATEAVSIITSSRWN